MDTVLVTLLIEINEALIRATVQHTVHVCSFFCSSVMTEQPDSCTGCVVVYLHRNVVRILFTSEADERNFSDSLFAVITIFWMVKNNKQ